MRYTKKLWFCLVIFFIVTVSASAQWNATLNINPYPSPYFSDWERDPSVGALNVFCQNIGPVEFHFRVVIDSRRFGQILVAQSDLIRLIGPFRQTFYSTEFLEWRDVDYDRSIEDMVVRSGRFPEGDYKLTVSLISGFETLAEDDAPFFIVYPDPPQLLLPSNGSTVTMPYPMFQWTPVITPPDYIINYHLLIVERLPGQSLQQAIEANYPHHEETITGLSFYNYPFDGLPFEVGKEYVWQITATDQNGFAPTSNDGKSEIWSFFYGSSGGEPAELPFDTLVIEPGAVYLVNLDALTVFEDDFVYTLNGSTELLLNLPGGFEVSVSVFVSDLILQKGNYEIPTFLSGSISGDLNTGDIPTELTGEYFLPQDIEFDPSNHVTIGGILNLPGDYGQYELIGRISLTASGLSGEASITGSPSSPVFTIGDEMAQLVVTQASVTFSEPGISLSGIIELFGIQSECNLVDLSLLAGGVLTGEITCAGEVSIPLVDESDRFVLILSGLSGNFNANLSTGDIDYNIIATGRLDFQPDESTSFGADIVLQISSSGISVESFVPRGDLDFSAIDLGWLNLQLSNLSLSSLSFIAGNWDFSLGMDLAFGFPAFDSLSLPPISGVTFGPDGFTIPETSIPSLYLPRVELGGFELEFLALSFPALSFSWFDWDPELPAEFSFDFDLRLRFPDFPEGTPIELRDPEIIINNASFVNGNFNATIPVTSFAEPGLGLPLGEFIVMNVMELSGSLGAAIEDGELMFSPDVRLRGMLELPPAFSCEGGDQALNLLSTSIQILGDGRLNGIIENIVPPCSLHVGLLSLAITNSNLNFYLEDDEQRILLDGTAFLGFNSPSGEPINATASFSYEFIQNRLLSLEGDINTPFVWEVPPSVPVLSFNIGSADINEEGIVINGRQSLQLGDEATLGVTFDNLAVCWDDFRINSGNVSFDMPFAFKVAFDGDELVYQAVPQGTELTEELGILLELPNSISIDADGFAVSGSSAIHLRFDGYDLPSLSGVYSSDFAFSLSPFKVSSGQLEFFSGEHCIALIDSRGFFPDLSYFGMAFLPEHLGLPVEDIAYLQIKDGDELLVDHEFVDSGLRLYTRPGQPVSLVMTSLQLGRPQPPQLNIEFDFTIDPVSRNLVDGSINVTVPPEQYADFDLSSLGIPFELRNLVYGDVNGLNVFQLGGRLKLFDTSISDEIFQLTLMPDGRLLGSIDFPVAQEIPLVNGSDNLTLSISNIAGSFETQFIPLDISFDLSLTGGIRLNLDDTTSYGASTEIGITEYGLEIRGFDVDTPTQLPALNLGTLDMYFSNFTIPSLTYDLIAGWDFEIGVDLGFGFPDIGFQLPQMSGVVISKNGIYIPEYSIPELSDSAYTFYGFGLKPLAFRMSAFTFDWFNFSGGPLEDWGFAFDFELSFPEFPEFVPPDLRNPQVTILNAGYLNGKITGSLETKEFDLPGLLLPLGGGLNFFVREIGGDLAVIDDIQNFNITFRGDIQMPEVLRCDADSGVADVMSTAFTIDSNGHITGTLTDFIPGCPLDIGFGQLAVTNSNVQLAIAGDQQSAIMDLSGVLRIPGTSEGDTITAAGSLSFDLINARILDGEIAVTDPFRWQIPQDDPVLVFTINNAVLNSSGLLINGFNTLILSEGATVGVNFNNLVFDITDFNIVSGEATFTSQFALKFITELGGLEWSAVDISAPITEVTGVRLTLPENISLSSNGFAASGETDVFIRFNGEDYTNIRCLFSESFNIGFSPFGVTSGQAEFFLDETLVAVLDSDGFHPGDLFGIIPLPEKLPLPDTSIAYIVLKDGEEVLVQTEPVSNGLHISTRPGEQVQLVIPALQYEAPEPPSFGIAFGVTVNVSTFELVEGSIDVSPPEGAESLLSLASAGIPLDLTQLLFSHFQGAPALIASARIALPEALGSVNVSLDSLVISTEGFSGSVNMGTFSEYYQQLDDYIADVPIGDMFNFKVGGVNATFGVDDLSFRLSGDIQTQFFSSESDTAAIHYVAVWENGEFGFGFDISHLPDAALPLYIATFRPEPIADNPAFDLSFPEGSIALTLSGTLSLTDFGDGFSVSFAGLQISPDGVTIPDINITTPEDFLNFELFSAQFEIKDIEGYPGISFDYENNIFYLSLSGELEFLNNTSSFHGLKIGTDGSVSIAGVSLISGEFYIVDDYIALTELGIQSSALVVEGFARLPEPCDTSKQTFNFSINPDGTVSGGANISIIDETPGLGGDDQSEFDLWVATFDPTYAALGFNFGNLEQSSLQMVADIYFMSDANKWLHIGTRSGGVVTPGLEIKFDGTVRWGNLQSAPGMFDVNWEALKLDSLIFASFDSETSDFALSISGKLNVNVEGVGGGLQFEDLHVTSSGNVENLAGSITGGDITITDIVTITISNIGYSSVPTDIQVTGGASCESMGDQGPNPPETQTIHVTSFFRFGASIDIAGVGGGGIREFLTYTTENSTHIIIDSAYVNIPDLVEFSIDLTYEQVGNEGFSLLMGGQGLFVNTYGIVVVGKIAHINDETSFGLFVAMDVSITIPPCLVLTGVGGGFFYNPTECDLALVREMAGFGGDNPASGRISDPGSFAVLLYAQVAIVQDYLVSGSVLLTITEGYFRLDGRVVLLNQDTYLNGSIYLCVGFMSGYAEGNITVDVTVGDFINGQTELAFYVYGEDAWGIKGAIDLSIMHLLDANAELFIGNPGFFIQMSISYHWSIWVLEVNAGFEAMAWYVVNVSWGMYAKVWVSAEAFWGLVSAKGWLEAALIGADGSWYIFGLAGIKGCVLGICKSASVWCKIEDGSISGGTGRNSEMDDLIDEAKSIGEDMEEEAEEAQDAIDEAIVQSFLLTDEELVEAFNNLYKAGQLLRGDNPWLQWFVILFLADVGELDEMELSYGEVPAAINWNWCQDHGFFDWDICSSQWAMFRSSYLQEIVQIPYIYENFFFSPDAPPHAARDSIRTLRNRVDNLVESSNDDRNQISNRLNQISATLAGIPELEYVLGDPVRSYNLDDPVTEEYVQGDTTYKRAISQPDFTLDEILANSNKDVLEQAEEDFGEYEALIVDKINTLESAIQSVDDALSGSGGEISFDQVGQNYANLMYKIGQFYFNRVSYNRQEQEYAREKASELQELHETLQAILSFKSLHLSMHPIGDTLLPELRDLTWARKEALLKLRMVGGIEDSLAAFNSRWNTLSVGVKRELSLAVGMQLWFDMCYLGFQHLDSVATATITSESPVQLRDELNNVGYAQSAYTTAIDPIFDAKVILTEKLYDILALYGEWQESQPDTVEWLIPHDQVISKKADLMNDLQVPQLNTINVTTYNADYYNYGAMNWSASHPRGISEYAILFNEQEHPTPPEIGLQSIGRRMNMVRYFLQQEDQTSSNWTLTLRARAGAGYTNQRQVNFVTYFSPDGGGGVGSYENYNMGGDVTAPATPTVTFPYYESRYSAGHTLYYYSPFTDYTTASWSSYDNESGIVEYLYSIGTSPGDTSILGWTSAGGLTEATIYDLQLQHGGFYCLNVVARNGENMWSANGKANLIIDTSPPPTPTARYYYEWEGPEFYPYTPPTVIPPVPLPPELVPPIGPSMPYYEPHVPGEPPSITTLWYASSDSQSYILGYQYRVISASDTTVRTDDWIFIGNDLGVTVTGGIVEYLDSFYIDVEAINYAGLTSEPFRSGPHIPPDPSPPSDPTAALCYGLPAGTNYLIFSERSHDYETDLRGYQIAVGTVPGGTDIVDWNNDTIDFDNSDIGVAESWVLPDLGLAQGTTCYISLRAVNNAGMISGSCVTGPYIIDSTPPITPIVSPSLERQGGRGPLLLRLVFSNVSDPESGIEDIEYAIGTSNGSTDVFDWYGSGLVYERWIMYGILGMTGGNTYYIGVRTINGIGLVSEEFWTSIYIPEE